MGMQKRAPGLQWMSNADQVTSIETLYSMESAKAFCGKNEMPSSATTTMTAFLIGTALPCLVSRHGFRILAGISILTSLPTDNIHPTLSVCNAPARLLNAESFRRPWQNLKAKN